MSERQETNETVSNVTSDYTPTTEEVELYFKNAVPEPYGSELDAGFDRWLIAERKRVAKMAVKKERKRITQILVGMKSDCTCGHCKRNNVYMDSLIDLIDGKTK